MTAVREQAEAKLKGATDAVAGAQAKAEAELAKKKAAVEAKVNEAKDKFLSLKGLQTSSKGANGEPASPFGLLAQFATKL